VAVIGGGFSGLVTGARLKQAGVSDVRLIEGGGDVGGAWYWNRYPGAMCDTAAMVYLPLLEETRAPPYPEVHLRARDLRSCAADRPPVRPV
jgi:cation diffusion facilitator CzcD-associated flavoprotein CzcO